MRIHPVPRPYMLCALCVALGLLVAFFALPVRADDDDPLLKPYLEAAQQKPSLADTPFTIIAWSEEDMVKGAYTHVGWTPRIQGRILGHTKSGDAVLVDFSQGGKLVKSLRVGLHGIAPSASAYCEDFQIAGNSKTDLITAVGDFDVTYKY
ncbi:MAG TPA: hypothetical protein VGM23_06110, partial [Armatimonadota bacterium]